MEKEAELISVREKPFKIYGLYRPESEKAFYRIPPEVAKAVRPDVERLNHQPAGGRVRFKTDSPFIVIKAVMPEFTYRPCMPLAGTSGFDIFINERGSSRYKANIFPYYGEKGGYERKVELGEERERDITVYFPTYAPVDEVYIGVKKGCLLKEGGKYSKQKPLLFYGSSITQGGDASRPSNNHPALIARRFDSDFINLGFSGNAFAEEPMTDYLATLDASVFIMDYDYNSPSADYLKESHEKFFIKMRKAHPDMPIIIVTKPNFGYDPYESAMRRSVIFETYANALNRGDKCVSFVDGESMFRMGTDADACTVDGVHPNELGFKRMADRISESLKDYI